MNERQHNYQIKTIARKRMNPPARNISKHIGSVTAGTQNSSAVPEREPDNTFRNKDT
mgnify:CR=1 FL=1